MKPRPGTCPITGKTHQEGQSKCPITRLFNWCRWRASSIVSTLPFREKNDVFDRLMQASIAFSDILLQHEANVLKRLIGRTDLYLHHNKPKQRAGAMEKLFVEYSTNSNGLLCEDFLLIFREIQIHKREIFVSASHKDEKTYSKISAAYQFGMRIIYDVWRDIFRAFVRRYHRIPTPHEMQQFETFIIKFVKNIGQTPALFSVPIRENMTRVQSLPNLFFDADGTLQFDVSKMKTAQHIAHEEFGQHTAETLKTILTNRYCPALPRIPKIAQMCCNVFRETYAHVYNQYPE